MRAPVTRCAATTDGAGFIADAGPAASCRARPRRTGSPQGSFPTSPTASAAAIAPAPWLANPVRPHPRRALLVTLQNDDPVCVSRAAQFVSPPNLRPQGPPRVVFGRKFARQRYAAAW